MKVTSGKVLKDLYHIIGDVSIEGTVYLGENVKINVTEKLCFKGDAIIRDHAMIFGRDITLGEHTYLDHHAEIGGGSCTCKESFLEVGKHFHLGSYTMVNTARPIWIGDVVGLGRMTNLYTHGVYLNVLDGFPEQWGSIIIGSNVWLPNATVLPNVTIGDNTVVGACSLVTKNIEGGGLWRGIPAERVKGVVYPNPMDAKERMAYLGGFVNPTDDELRRHGIRNSQDVLKQ